jgi:hypothetical protein
VFAACPLTPPLAPCREQTCGKPDRQHAREGPVIVDWNPASSGRADFDNAHRRAFASATTASTLAFLAIALVAAAARAEAKLYVRNRNHGPAFGRDRVAEHRFHRSFSRHAFTQAAEDILQIHDYPFQ